MEAWEPIEIAQDPRMWSVPGRRLRVGITRIIQHTGLLDAIERNRTEPSRTILSRAKHNRAVLYYTILYYTILYYTILYYTILYCTVLYIILCYVKNKKGSRAVSAFSVQIWHHHHSSLRHAQELKKLAAAPSVYLLRSDFSAWLDRVASSRNSIKTIDFS